MCGICGIYNVNGNDDLSVISRMTVKLTHRGPDDKGFFSEGPVSLGMRRLSIIDLDRGKQPILNEEKNICLIFNGEIYNYKQLRLELEEKGHEFSTSSDTETIIHAYEEYGRECVQKLKGMFAFAIYDARNKSLFLARDPFGIKPLFYTLSGNTFVFASEIKSLFQYPGVKRMFDESTFAEKFLFGYSINDSTIFEGVKSVMPAHWISVSPRSVKENGLTGIRQQRYWSYSIKPDSSICENDAVKRLKDLLEESVRRRLMSDVGFGVFLSGGIDSSVIAAISSKLSDRPIKTFTVGVEGNKDFEHARIVAESLGTDHHEVITSETDPDKTLCEYVYALEDTEPTGTGPLIVSKGARKWTKMALCGQASDELLGGYPKYKEVSGAHDDLVSRWSSISIPIRSNQRLRNTLDYLNKYTSSIQANGFYGLLHYDLGFKLTNNQLATVDRTSMAASVEVRVPFLDTDLVSFLNTVPSELKMKNNTEKYILRRVAAQYSLPEKIIKREKYMPSMDPPKATKAPVRNQETASTIRREKLIKPISSNYRRVLDKDQRTFLDLLFVFFIINKGEIPGNFSISDIY